MNQILQTNLENKKILDLRRVIKIFSILIIIFGFTIIIKSVYDVNKEKQKDKNNSVVQEKIDPTIDAKTSEGYVVINIKLESGIEKMIYSWNNDESKSKNYGKSKEIQEKIELPLGTNQLNLTIIDSYGYETIYQEEYTNESKTTIEIELVENENSVKIKAYDEGKINKISYKWNNGQEVVIDKSSEDTKNVEMEIEVPVGQNTLTIIAENKLGNTSEKKQTVKGVLKPVTKYIVQSGKYVEMQFEDAEGIKYMEITVNGVKNTIQNNNAKQLNYKQEVQEGENIIEIKVYNIEGVYTEFIGRCMYPSETP